MGHAVDLRPAGAAHFPRAGAQGDLSFEDAVPAAPAPPSAGAGPAGGQKAVELGGADFFQEQAVDGGDRAVGFFPVGQSVAQNGVQALAAGSSGICSGCRETFMLEIPNDEKHASRLRPRLHFVAEGLTDAIF